ncbi:HNH endonuclease [Erysipelothrix rhusiopathiae]|nr:HNH endonuclease [Erysipelothrix rhusiopathiae]MDE8117662.1 HNH endonuclease [Erysipelothrix rhusiopathiae]MDE8252879.1 HNH endonuclease [Erysipelothrix rhusiopathiae]MDE8260058.1 HNH endonuclease [Erysipelothrix rhusiopathiae]MDE8260951.1 HNH endonuclease [Erysipelothrix rhusiopathiae]
MNKFVRSKHGVGIREENLDIDEEPFYNYILNSQTNKNNHYSVKTAENYVGAISELFVMLVIRYGLILEYNSRELLWHLLEIKNDTMSIEEGYMVGRKTANDFKSMNRLWNGTYSAAIGLFEKYISDSTESGYLPEIKTDYYEGDKKKVSSIIYERNPESRKMCLMIKGLNCSVCNINFREEYGAIGENYIHVHHQRPLHSYKNPKLTNVVEDLFPVCPNCHAMIHKTDPIMDVSDFKKMYRRLNNINN